MNITTRSYTNKTIFEQLSEAGRDWAVYYGGFPPQSLAFTRLWASVGRNWLQRFKPIEKLYRAIRNDRLPNYSFVEPEMLGKTSDSQHPGMGGESDFRAGELLIWRIYQTLYDNPTVFKKTLLLITYDEHGGFFDHVPPPQGPEYSVYPHYQDKDYEFTFDLLGARVPAVLSPWIAPGTVDYTIYDHAIPATVRKVFHVSAPPLSNRDARANTFERVLNLDLPRERLPRLQEPLVDEKARRLAQGLELRESLAWILRELVWVQLMRQPGRLLVRQQSEGDPLSFRSPPMLIYR
jgi:phospholipase C